MICIKWLRLSAQKEVLLSAKFATSPRIINLYFELIDSTTYRREMIGYLIYICILTTRYSAEPRVYLEIPFTRVTVNLD